MGGCCSCLLKSNAQKRFGGGFGGGGGSGTNSETEMRSTPMSGSKQLCICRPMTAPTIDIEKGAIKVKEERKNNVAAPFLCD